MTKRQLRWLLLVIFGLIVLVFWWHSRAVTPDKPHPSALSAHQTIVFPKETNGLPGQAQLKSGQLVEKDGKQYRTLSASLPQQSGKIYFYCQVSEIGDKKGIKKLLAAGYQAGKNHVFDGQLQFYLPEENRIHFTVSGRVFSQTKLKKVTAQSKPTDEVGVYEIQVVAKNALINSLLDHQDLVY
ncbi:hypothetical protein EA456_10660 [Streptococcus dysgalactiae subsp. dysgalactiae]|nr:hypothetical protein [Streptococcus dysgalactiae]EGR89095.1 hypothetical protein HMPREF9963_0475 [Streptococcus dysgalactiae subsp. equisimilis SK1250]MBM6514408.1 hypothetical protein [Streptococcus dysgalactiae subsp. equisimilis]MBM6534088.1 hypothetical protein [Streptococcus dysgalactiae subsp. equisimilis]MBM6548829.1 hypothetical protein [Streptococcus dysgalactiae subsp. equisimilis]MCY7220088.1 hypothetical protein [Streptococcus dysgalactiae]